MRWGGFLTFVVWPCVEIAVAIALAQSYGWGPVIAAQVLLSVLGLLVLRAAGQHSARALSRLSGGGGLPTAGETADTGLRFLAGLLLLVPGFVSDAVGLLLTIPPVRPLTLGLVGGAVARRAGRWVVIGERFPMSDAGRGGPVIPGQVVREDQPRPPDSPPPPALPGAE
jgi:UPF0716 protein FxsA